MAKSDKTTPPSPSLNSSIATAASHLVTIKLIIDNYLLWKAQIEPFLCSHQLFDHLDGSASAPVPTIDGKLNPAYTTWSLQDQLILSALNSTLSESVLNQVLECKTAQQVWQTLQNLFTAQSSAHIMHTHFQLATLKKGSESITEYYNKAKSLAATLGAASHTPSDQEFTIYLLAGLGSDYESLVTSLTTRPNPLTPHQIYSFLLNHESRLSHQTNSLLSGMTITANNTHIRPPDTSGSAAQGRNSSFRGGRRGRGYGRRGGGRGSSPQQSHFFQNSDSRPHCQVCHKYGHTTATCYYRYDHSYQTPPPSSFAANFTSVSPPMPPNVAWFPDTGASHHFTPDYTNLNLDSASYQGSDQVSIGDGSSLPIQHHGFSFQGGATSGNR
ncbi:hypothetical protein F2P56_019229 [Juglans regia]|uniref:Uncharacterized protein n=1 Tax=Juglans regia TaxID=51240 RepID=A0A833XBB2_JUGRE|nr:hypothetical protein F2P56_019229 [Juglans regia]